MELVQLRKPQFVPPTLQITAMMDMFTIIVFFLMFSYSEVPNDIDLDRDINLPESLAKLEYQNEIKLILTKSSLKIDDLPIASISQNRIDGFDAKAPEKSSLYLKLKEFRELKAAQQQKAAELNSPSEQVAEQTGEAASSSELHLLFFCDRELPFSVINQVIKTAAMAGFPNFQLAVLEQ